MRKSVRYLLVAVFACVPLILFFFFFRESYDHADVIIVNEDNQLSGVLAAEAAGSIEAQSAIVINLRTGETLIKKDPSLPVPIASITKIAAAMVALKYLKPDDIVQIKEEDLAPEGGRSLEVGQVWSAYDLLKYSLITSSNEAINAVARTVSEKRNEPFAPLMNKFAAEHGLHQTHFVNPSGLDIHTGLSGSESSARDIALLLRAFYERYPAFATITRHPTSTLYTQDGTPHEAKNTNTAIKDIPGLLVSKTGFTSRAGGNLGVIVKTVLPDPVVAVALGSTRAGRFSDIALLIEQVKGPAIPRAITADNI